MPFPVGQELILNCTKTGQNSICQYGGLDVYDVVISSMSDSTVTRRISGRTKCSLLGDHLDHDDNVDGNFDGHRSLYVQNFTFQGTFKKISHIHGHLNYNMHIIKSSNYVLNTFWQSGNDSKCFFKKKSYFKIC